MYLTALFRYELVGPLALLGKENPLKTSRALTQGSVWRLVGVSAFFYFLFSVFLFVLIFLLPSHTFKDILSYASPDKTMPLSFYPLALSIKFVVFFLGIAISPLVSLSAYKVLSKEKAVT
jgi:hypothetical protein